MDVKIYDADNHGIENYVASVQEPFGIVTFTDSDRARKYPLDEALRIIELVNRTSNGHFRLRYEF